MAKRGNRDGTIRKRHDGRYEGRVLLGYRDGKRVRPSFYGDTRQSVRQEMQRAVRDWERGLIVGGDAQTVEQFLNAWVEDTAKPRLRPRTYAGYKHHVENNIVPGLGALPLRKLTPQHVQRLLNEKSDAGLAPRTVAGIRAVLRAALNDAVAWNLLDRNPAQHVRPPRPERAEAVTLSPEQAKKLLDTAKGHWLGPLISVALAVGLRLGEALGLGWNDVDLENKTLRVTRALQRVSIAVAPTQDHCGCRCTCSEDPQGHEKPLGVRRAEEQDEPARRQVARVRSEDAEGAPGRPEDSSDGRGRGLASVLSLTLFYNDALSSVSARQWPSR